MALATFETARDNVCHPDSQLSFLTNAARIYDDYVHFLVARGKTDDALRWADFSRARTLAEGLGLLAKGTSRCAAEGASKETPARTSKATANEVSIRSLAAPPALNAQEIARRAKGTLLFYWLGEKQSYLWAIAPQKTQLYSLPPGAEIEAAVQRYRKALAGPQDVLASANEDGRWLYRTLVAPAEAALAARSSAAKAAIDIAVITARPKAAHFKNQNKTCQSDNKIE